MKLCVEDKSKTLAQGNAKISWFQDTNYVNLDYTEIVESVAQLGSVHYITSFATYNWKPDFLGPEWNHVEICLTASDQPLLT